MNKYIVVFISFLFFSTSCKQETKQIKKESKTSITDSSQIENSRPLPNWASQANIYEVNIRQYTSEGTFDAFAKHLPRLKAMGVDILWFMPIFPISETKKKGTLGSYYAVSNFRETNPEFGSKESFQNIIDRAHTLGMKVILDWVPNHTGWDHVWIKSNPEYYTQNSSGEIIDPVDPGTGESWGWTDVADLNYDNANMRKQMIDDMLYWVNNHKIDGYRMDVAHNVPNDFWADASSQLFAANDSFYMLAESEFVDHVNNGYFHTIYGWSLHHMMNDIAKGNKNVNDLHTLLQEKKSQIKQGSMMNFITNHDENSWAGTVKERMGPAADAFAVLAMTMDGFPLIYGGQEEQLDRRLEFFEKDNIGFKKYEKAKLYKTLLDLKHRNKAMGNNEYSVPLKRVGESEYIYAYMKEKDGDKFAVMINLSDEKQQIKLTESVIGMTDLLKGRRVEMGQGTIKSFDPWEYWIASNK
jgi:glycosidase